MRHNLVRSAAVLLLAGIVAVAFSGAGYAQGSMQLSNFPTNTGGPGTPGGGSFDIIAGATPLRIWRVAAARTAVGTADVEVTYRLGGFSSVYPPTDATDLIQTGWTSLGTASVNFLTAHEPYQVPLDLNVVIPPGQRLGVVVRMTAGNISYWAQTVGLTYQATDANMTIDYYGIGGGVNATVGSAGINGQYFPRGPITTVWYDFDQFTGTHTGLMGVSVNNNGPMSVGNNTVSADVRNMGTAALDSQNIVAEYSVDGGTNWSSPQTFSFPSFPPLSTQSITFTTPANIPAVSAVQLQVRLVAPTPIGQGEALKSRSYVPDLDVTSIVTNPTAVQLGVPFSTSVTVSNNGDWNLNGQSVSLRYSIDGGQNFTTQSFTASTLGANASSESFSFTQPATINVAGTYSLDVDILPQVSGDPDSADSLSLAIENVGYLHFEFGTGTTSGTLGPPVYRATSLTGNGNYSVYQMLYPASMLAGMPANVILRNIAFYKDNDTRTLPGLSHPLRIWLSNSNDTALVGNETVGNFAASAGTLVHDEPNHVFPATIGWINFGEFNGSTPFTYSGGGLLVTVEWSANGPTATGGGTGSFAWRHDVIPSTPATGRGYNSTSANPPSSTASITLGGLTSNTEKPHARFFYTSATPVDLDLESVSFGVGANVFPGIGSNSINVTVRNMGAQAFTGSYQLSYSTDGGSNWTTPQTVTAAGLTSFGTTQTVTLSTPWSIPAVGAQQLRVRIDPPVAGDPDLTDEIVASYAPDADVEFVGGTGPNNSLTLGNNTITATIRNNGSFSLEGATLPLQFSTDGGTNWLPATPQLFTGGAALASNGGSQVFQFPGTVYFTPGVVTLMARMSPVLAGDPDVTDEKTRMHIVGSIEKLVLDTAPEGSTTSVGVPFNLNTYPVSRTQAVYYASELAATGMVAGDLITGLALKTGDQVSALTEPYRDVRIGMMHTTDTTLLATVPMPTIPTFQNVFGPHTFVPSEITPLTFIDMPFHTPFIWNGTDNILIDVHHFNPTVGGGNMSITTSTGLTGARLLRAYNASSAYPWEPPTASINATTGAVPKIKFYVNVPAAQDLNVDSISFGSGPSSYPGLGNNTINVTVVNFGTAAITSQFGLSFSTDGGSNWSPTQMVTASGLANRLDTQTVALSAPMNLTAPSALEVRVRIEPQIAGDPDASDVGTFTFAPDLDVVSVGTTGPNGEIALGQNTIVATVQNNGSMGLEGAQIPLQYSIDGGQTWLPAMSEMFTGGPALAAVSGQQTFQFPNPVSFGSGAASLSVRVFPQLVGDPDTSDEATISALVGVQPIEILANEPFASNTTTGFPFLLNTYTATRTTAIYYASELAAAGLVAGDPIVGMSLMTGSSTTPLTADYSNFRVGVQHTTRTLTVSTLTLPLSSEYLHVFGPETLPAASLTPSTYIDFPFSTPFIWNGVDNIEFDFQYYSPTPGGGSLGITAVTGLTGNRVTRSYLNGGIQPYEPSTGNINVTSGVVPKIRVMVPTAVATDLDISAVSFGPAQSSAVGTPSVGANQVHVTVSNSGTGPLAGQFGLGISTDGGATWTPSQMFTVSGLAARHDTQTVTLSAPWNIASVGASGLRVRIDPQVAGDPDPTDRFAVSAQPDLDVVDAMIGPMHRINVPLQVSATLRNAGSFDLSGQSVTLRYRIDQGAWSSTNVSLAGLAETGSEQVVTFPVPHTFAAIGSYQLEVELVTPPTDDPDLVDAFVRALPNFGDVVVNIGVVDFPGATSGTQSIPLNSTTEYSLLTVWTPEQLRFWSGDILEFGFQYSSAAFTKTWPWVEISFGETSKQFADNNLSYDQMFDIVPATVALSGPMTVTTAAAEDYGRVQLTTPFTYSGQNNLAMLIRVDPNASSPASSVRVYSNVAVPNYRQYASDPYATVATTTNSRMAHGASFVFQPTPDPGLAVSRNLQVVSQNTTDELGISVTATSTSTLNYSLVNRGAFNPLAISSVFVSNQVNTTASIVGTAPTSVPPGGVPVALNIDVTPSAGPYSFDVTIVSNTAQPNGSPFTWTVSGTGFVNTAPVLSLLSGSLKSVLITEVVSDPGTSSNEFIELTNVSSSPVDISGWELTVYDSGSTTLPGGFHAPYTGYPKIITGTVLMPGQTWVLADSTAVSPSNESLGANILWNASYAGGVMIRDTQLNIVDVMAFGPPASINPSQITAPAPFGAEWSGPPIDMVVVMDNGIQRIGFEDTNSASDWHRPGGNTIGQLNPGLQLPFGGGSMQVSGTHPSFTAETIMGEPLASVIRVVDPDSHQNVTITVTEVTGAGAGTLTAAAAGFTNAFPLVVGPTAAPAAAIMQGDAAASGTVVFSVQVSDDGVFPLGDAITVTYRIGAKIEVTSVVSSSLFVRTSGVKDFYRGETNKPVNLTIDNPNPFAVELQSLNFTTVQDGTSNPITGIGFALQGAPVTVPANAIGHAVVAMMDIAAGASGTNGVTVALELTSAVAIDPANQSGNPIVVQILAPIDVFDLYDGPVPQPMEITTTAFNPAVETVSFLQDLLVSGGLGSYTWSVAASSASGFPQGLTLNPAGNQFLPASVQGTPAAGSAAASPYVITLEVTDGAYVATRTLTMNVSVLTPLTLLPVTLPNGEEYVAYPGFTLQASGGSQIYNYSVDLASTHGLPAGLTLNAQTGVISGMPADGTQGTYNITFAVSDGFSSDTEMATLVVAQHPLAWRSTTLPVGQATVAYSTTLDAIGGASPRTYTINPSSVNQLPAGLTLNQISGEISGIPGVNSAASYNITFTVTDGNSVNVSQVMLLQIDTPAPLAFETKDLEYAVVGSALSQSILATGGSQVYSYALSGGGSGHPVGVSLSSNGLLTFTPQLGDEGRYQLNVAVNDGYQTANRSYSLSVLPVGASAVKLTEVDVGIGYIEFTNLGLEPVDVSGWSITAWVDGSSPVSFAFDSLPGALLSLPTEVVTLTIGGTAGGAWPSFSTGSPWAATASSDLAVALFDRYGNVLDLVRIGNIDPSTLVDGSSSLVSFPEFLTADPALTSGSANHSLTSAGWVASAAGTHFEYNPGLASFTLTIVNEELVTAVEGNDYNHPLFALGGKPPYTWTLTAPSHSWLSINPNTGVLTGTPPTGSATVADVTVQVTDSNMATANITEPLPVTGPSGTAVATIAVGQGSGHSFAGTVIGVPVTLTTTASDISGFSFIIQLPPATVAQVALHRVIAGPATKAAGRSLVARNLGDGKYFVGDMDGPGQTTPVLSGEIATIELIVPLGGPDAAQGTYAVQISNANVSRTAAGVHLTAGSNGELVLSNYSPADVNRDGNINVVDVQRTVNLILQTATEAYPGQGDVNGDSLVNVVDVQRIVNCILNSSLCP